MELFTKQMVNDLKPFQGLQLFSEWKFSKDVFVATTKGALKIFNQNI